MKRKNLFLRITKVDQELREVSGILAAEEIDKVNETFDYASSKPYFQKWNEDFTAKTEGKSVGNLRAMHESISAGKFISMDYDDAKKLILCVAKVVDDKEWEKVVEGVYTGFSIGAFVVGKMWKDADNGSWRYTANPIEGSLVDNPCIYSAVFTGVKAAATSRVETLQAAMRSLTSKIEQIADPKEKGLYAVGFFADILCALNDLALSLEYETEWEGDNSPIASQVRECARQLGDLLVAYCAEEVAEENSRPEVAEMSVRPSREAGLRPSTPIAAAGTAGFREGATPAAKTTPNPTPAASAPAAPKTFSQEEVDALVAAEREKAVNKTPAAPAAAPAVIETPAETESISKSELEALRKKAADLEAENTTLAKAVEDVANQVIPSPVKAKGSVVVAKEADGADPAVATQEKPKTSLEAIKLAQKQPNSRVSV